jgi:hypothetical protein
MYYIKYLDLFQAILCSSSGGQNCILQPLVLSLSVSNCAVHRLREDCSPLSTGALHSRSQRVTIPDAVKYNFDVLKMIILLLETIEVFNVIHILQNKGIVHQVGNKNKFILWCTVRKTSNKVSFCLKEPPKLKSLVNGKNSCRIYFKTHKYLCYTQIYICFVWNK